jgi:hypothetical protein
MTLMHPFTSFVNDKIDTFSRAQASSLGLINQNLEIISETVSAKATEDHAASLRLED